ncbi:MAG TPA: hypothetical protein VG028_06205 [Terriglobia bacterium]|nr:hypothetical protein [Terriglobia bacterium]
MEQEPIRFPSRYDYKHTALIDIAFNRILALRGWTVTENTDLKEFVALLTKQKLDLQITFDLSNTEYIGLEQVGSLIIFGRFCHNVSGHKVKLVFPKLARLAENLLLPWNFFEFFSQWGEPASPISDKGEPWPPYNSLPFTRIREISDVQRTARDLKKPKIEKILRETFNLDADQRNVLVDTIVSEVCDNIPFHSMSEGVVAVQLHVRSPMVVHLPSFYQPKIDIVISDGGIGILQSLRMRYPSVYSNKSARDALNDVFSGSVPQPEGKSRGGIARTRNAIQAFGGIFEIRTPFSTGTCYPERLNIRTDGRFFPGTHVKIKLPTPEPRGKEGVKYDSDPL